MQKRPLWIQNEIVGNWVDIPLVPRYYWLSARKAYEADDPIGAILLTGLAIESGVSEYAAAWFYRRFGKNITEAKKFLEDWMDFRKTVNLLWFIGSFRDELKDNLHDAYNDRVKYTHTKVIQILGDKGNLELVSYKTEQAMPKIKVKDDENAKIDFLYMNAQEDAWNLLRKTEVCLRGLFNVKESDYWKILIWNVKGDT